MSILRVKPGVVCIVHDAATDSMVPLKPGIPYDEHDPIVRQFPWAFGADTELDEGAARRTSADVGYVEQATAAPGEKRGTRLVIPGAVTLGYLHPGHLSACFTESLFELLIVDLTGKQRIMSHPHGKLAKECGSAGIVDGRNKLAQVMCDESQAEWLFMVDSDMGFGPDTLERLIEVATSHGAPVVGALAFAHKTDGRGSFYGIRYRAQPTLYRFVEQDDKVGVTPIFDYPRDELVEVAATGGACLLIHRTALEAIRAKHGDAWFDPITHPKGPTTFSEDLSFCFRLASVDLPLFVHTGIKTTHDKGGMFLDEEYFDRQQAMAS